MQGHSRGAAFVSVIIFVFTTQMNIKTQFGMKEPNKWTTLLRIIDIWVYNGKLFSIFLAKGKKLLEPARSNEQLCFQINYEVAFFMTKKAPSVNLEITRYPYFLNLPHFAPKDRLENTKLYYQSFLQFSTFNYFLLGLPARFEVPLILTWLR